MKENNTQSIRPANQLHHTLYLIIAIRIILKGRLITEMKGTALECTIIECGAPRHHIMLEELLVDGRPV